MEFSVRFKGSKQNFPAQMKAGNSKFNAGFGNVHTVSTTAEVYEGKYEVTPTVDGEVLPTKNKKMRDDVTVKAIPTYEVHNPSGGTTFYIASSEELIITEG